MTAAHAAVYFTNSSGMRTITAAFAHDFAQTISKEPLYWKTLPTHINTLQGVTKWLSRGPSKYALQTKHNKGSRMIYYAFISSDRVLITWVP